MSQTKLSPVVSNILAAKTMTDADATAVQAAAGKRVDDAEFALLGSLRDALEAGQLQMSSKAFKTVIDLRDNRGQFKDKFAEVVSAPARGFMQLMGDGGHVSPGGAVTSALLGVVATGIAIALSPVTVPAATIAGAIAEAQD